MTTYLFILFILGTCFGSFSTVLISRWNSGKGGIMTGRSECPNCGHILTAIELIPIISWLMQLGQCKNCVTSIPKFYPASELLMGLLFAWSGYISYQFGYIYTDIMWWIFLFFTFITGVYILYDMRYMEIPDQILIPGIITVIVSISVGLYDEKFMFYFDIYNYPTFHTFLSDHIFAAIMVYSFFFLQILIPGIIYLIRIGKSVKIFELIGSYFILPIIFVYDFFVNKSKDTLTNRDDIEIPAWIGGGDLRIAIFIGLTLGTIHSISTLVFAYIIGSLVGIMMLAYSKIRNKEIHHEIPFGPFLGIGWILSLTFHQDIMDYLQILYN